MGPIVLLWRNLFLYTAAYYCTSLVPFTISDVGMDENKHVFLGQITFHFLCYSKIVQWGETLISAIKFKCVKKDNESHVIFK